ncbi:MAG: AMP-binding protein, partial [Acidobacteriota bacterium]
QLDGALDPARLARATRAVIARHAALRTRIDADERGRPHQTVAAADDAAPAFRLVDLRAADATVEAACVRRAIARAVRRPFDFRRDPMLRVVHVRLADARHVLVLVQHHIASDGWSSGLVLRDFARIYRAPASPLPPAPPLRAVDVAVWQRTRHDAAGLADDLAWWRRTLTGTPDLALPLDRPRPPRPRGRGGEMLRSLPAALGVPLRALGQRTGATPFMIAMAAFQATLARLSGQGDFAIGTPIAGRDAHPALDQIVGLFINLVALRADVSDAPSLSALVTRVRARALDAFARQHVPFDRVVDALALPRTVGRPPVFQVMLTVHNQPREAFDAFDDAIIGRMPRAAKAARYDLTLHLWQLPGDGHDGHRGDGLAMLEYDADLFDRTAARRLLDGFTTLFAAGLDAPDVPIAQLPWLPRALRAQVVRGWNDTRVAWPRDASSTIDGRIAAQARRTPDAIAVAEADDPSASLTYAALLREADRVADRLRGLGVGPEMRVPVLLPRSRALVVALLGVLRSGAAYVPLDPGYPAARLAHMLEDAGRDQPARMLLTSRATVDPLRDALGDALDAYRSLEIAFGAGDRGDGLTGLDDLPSIGRDAAAGPIDDPHRAAYAIYTSGSTGKPKGTINAHAGVVNRIDWMQQAFGLTSDDRVLQKTPASFDVSVWEFFWPLMTGARLVMASPNGHRDPAYLVETIRAHGITTLHFVPSMLALFLDAPDLASLASLRRVMASGEALPASLVARFGASLPSTARLHNLYGPTEAAIDVTWWPCPSSDGSVPALGVPIGRPIANVRTYVV